MPADRSDAEISLDDDLEEFEDVDTGFPERPHRMPAGSVARVSDDVSNVVADEDVIDSHSPEEQDLDAFIDGKKRPSHLDRSEPVDLSDFEDEYDDDV
jgi:hypothetical protein